MRRDYLKIFALSSLLLLPLVSCSSKEGETSSNESPSTSSSSSTPIEEEDISEIAPKDVLSFIKKLGQANSYKLISSRFSESEYTDYLTPNYYWSTGLNSGYILKESFDKSYGSSIVYNFKIEDNEVKLCAPKYSYEQGKIVYINDLNSLFHLKIFNGDYKNKIGIETFSTNNFGGTYTDSRYVIEPLAAASGYTDEESLKLIKRVSFYSQGNGIGYVFQGSQDGKYFSYEQTNTLIYDINAVSYPLIDTYFATQYALGKQMINEEALSSLSLEEGKIITLDNKANVYIDKKDQGTNLASKYLYSSSQAEIILIDPSSNDTISNIYQKGEEDKIYEIGYLPTGEVSNKLYSRYLSWDDLYPSIKEEILSEKEAFRLEEGEYVYYGRLISSFASFFAQMKIPSSPERMALTINNNGHINGARFEYPLTKYEYEGQSFIYRYILNSSLTEDSDSFTTLTTLPESSKIVSIDKAYLAFNGDNPFKASFKDSLAAEPDEYLTYTKDIYLRRWEKNTFGGTKRITAEGIYQNGDNIVPFYMTNNGEYFATSSSYKGNILDELPKNLFSGIFLQKEDGSFSLREHTLSYLEKALPLNYHASSLVRDSFSMSLNKEGKIDTISYKYLADSITTREETVSYSYDDVSLSIEEETAIKNLAPFKEPTSWQEESKEVYDALYLAYGEEAKNIPYVYFKETYKRWEASSFSKEGGELLNRTYSGIDSSFYEEYRKALLKNGFTREDPPSLPGAEIYNLGKIKIRLAKILSGGLWFNVNE